MITTILLGATIVGFAIYAFMNPPKSWIRGNTLSMDYSKESMSELDVNLIHTMVNGYRDKQLAYIENTMTMDAHSIWFDLETLKKFIYHTEIEFNTRNNDKNITSKDLGLRIYYANYPEYDVWDNYSDLQAFKNNNPITHSYSHLHTIVAIPTIKKGELNFDFNPLVKDTYKPNKENIKATFPTNSTARTAALGGAGNARASSNSNGAQNHGSLIPPVDGSGEGF